MQLHARTDAAAARGGLHTADAAARTNGRSGSTHGLTAHGGGGCTHARTHEQTQQQQALTAQGRGSSTHVLTAHRPSTVCPPTDRSYTVGPLHRFRTFIPGRWETMVGTMSYIIIDHILTRADRPHRT